MAHREIGASFFYADFSPSGFAPEGLVSFAVVPFGPAAFFVASSFAPPATTEDRSISLLRAMRYGGQALRRVAWGIHKTKPADALCALAR
jgi:hypothetical protein